MCQFVSWIERRGKIYFLTMNKLTDTRKGKELLKTISMDDLCGHGTIRAYYGIDSGDGTDRECDNFSTPANFPSVIVEAIKSGKMRGMGFPEGLLTAPAYKAYQEAKAPAYKAYQEATAPAYKAYQEAKAPAEKAYQEATAPAYKAYQETTDPAEKA